MIQELPLVGDFVIFLVIHEFIINFFIDTTWTTILGLLTSTGRRIATSSEAWQCRAPWSTLHEAV